MKQSRTVVGLLAVGLVLTLAGAAQAIDYTWQGASGGDWWADGNWSPAGGGGGGSSADTFTATGTDILATTGGNNFHGNLELDNGATLQVTRDLYTDNGRTIMGTGTGGVVEFPVTGQPQIWKGTWGAVAGSSLTFELGNATGDGGWAYNTIDGGEAVLSGAGDIVVTKGAGTDSFLQINGNLDMTGHTGTLDLRASVYFDNAEADLGNAQTIKLNPGVTVGSAGYFGDQNGGFDATLAGTGTIGQVVRDTGTVGPTNVTYEFAATGKMAPGTASAAGTIAFEDSSDLTAVSGTDLEFNIFAGGTFDQLTFDTGSVFTGQTLADLFIEVETGATLGTYDIVTGGGTYASAFASVTWSDGAAGTISYGEDLIQINLTDAPQIPEPATLSLLALGGLGALIRRRRARA